MSTAADDAVASAAPKPAAATYDNASLTCDLVMKGGVTSGVVYPSLICELARTYRFKNIGGTSAGAIAASTAAAAEYARCRGRGGAECGFERLATMPAWLGEGTHLSDLFQPSRKTWSLFTFVMSFLGGGPPVWKVLRGLIVACACYWPATLRGVLIVALLVAVIRVHETAGGLAWAIIWLACALIVALAVAQAIWDSVRTGLVDNGFGLCSGLDRVKGKDSPLTEWLTDEIDRIAGIPLGTYPLTFGDLWRPPSPGHARAALPPNAPLDDDAFALLPLSGQSDDDGLPPPSERRINLRTITTCLTFGHPFSMPWTSRGFYIHPEDARRLFPPHVCRWLVEHAAQPKTKSEAIRFELLKPLMPLPPPERMPVIVAARLSLVFPILLTAARLYAIDWTKSENKRASRLIDQLVAKLGARALEYVRGMLPENRAAAGIVPVAEPCWFCDGGISSNFPVQFFDAPLPRWPTFAVDLEGLPEGVRASEDEARNVWIPQSNQGGRSDAWNRFGSSDPRATVIGYLGTIFDTSRNWVDSAQARTAGYRDRVVHVQLQQDEGGLNLRMKSDVLKRLTARGREAAKLLVRHFAPPESASVLTNWENHRWVRYRSYVAMTENVVGAFQRGYDTTGDAGAASYAAMIDRGPGDRPASYRFKRQSQRNWAKRLTATLVQSGVQSNEAAAGGDSLADGAPRPLPELLVKPRM